MTNPDPLLHDVLSLCELVGMTPTAFGRAAAGDPTLIGKMRRGRLLGVQLERRVRAAMARIEDEFVERSRTTLAALEARRSAPSPTQVNEDAR